MITQYAKVLSLARQAVRVSEVIPQRWLHDSHVDGLAERLQPPGIDWFHRPAISLTCE
jgi:hypothetical protein